MGNQQAEQQFALERNQMVEDQIVRRGIRDASVLDAMRKIPRHLFVPEEQRHLSYVDGPLPIGYSQTISQPYIVAFMSERLALRGEETVLEVGTGSGYQAAILSRLAQQVHTIERYPRLAEAARKVLHGLGITNVQVHVGDGSLGLPEYTPYAAIMVTAAAPHVPKALLNQLADGGRLVIPVGGHWGQYLECWQRKGAGYEHQTLSPVAFVPLRGEDGWKEED